MSLKQYPELFHVHTNRASIKCSLHSHCQFLIYICSAIEFHRKFWYRHRVFHFATESHWLL